MGKSCLARPLGRWNGQVCVCACLCFELLVNISQQIPFDNKAAA